MTLPNWSGLVAEAAGALPPCKARIAAARQEAIGSPHIGYITTGSTVDRTVAVVVVIGHRNSCSLVDVVVMVIVKVVDRNTFAKKWEQKGKNK